MATLTWSGYIPNNNWQGAMNYLNNFCWQLSLQEAEQEWRLWSGDQLLFKGDTQAELESFLCGMAMSLAVLPDDLLREIQEVATA